MKQKTVNTPKDPRGNCIGCHDCRGMCQALMELAFVPETVLKSTRATG